MTVENAESAKKNPVLGDFQIKRQLGKGGMGVVYLAHQISLDRDCALKVMAKELAAKSGFVERFIREARSMAKIQHPNVVSCYAVNEDKGLHFVAMELIDGKSAQDWLKAKRKLSIADSLLITCIIGEALHFAHELNMVHRDVKPDNILITSKGVIKLSDLGLAKAVDETDMSLTQSGTGLGTPHYMAPEQARNAKHVDRRCDVYALGCTLYHFLTGQTPFTGDSLVDLITNKEKGRFTPAHRVNPEVSERLSLMIDKAMAQDTKNRYQSCADLIRDLESLGLTGESLSFIDGDQRTVVRRRGSGASTVANPHQKTTVASNPRNEPVVRPHSQWFVRYEEGGKVRVDKLSAAQVIAALQGDKFNEQTQCSMQANGPFLPLVQVPVFEKEARRLIARLHTDAHHVNLSKEYKRLARQYERLSFWRRVHKTIDESLGIVGVLLYIGVIAGVGVGLYYLIPAAWQLVADFLGVSSMNRTP